MWNDKNIDGILEIWKSFFKFILTKKLLLVFPHFCRLEYRIFEVDKTHK